jgi:hypothetical protein
LAWLGDPRNPQFTDKVVLCFAYGALGFQQLEKEEEQRHSEHRDEDESTDKISTPSLSVLLGADQLTFLGAIVLA